MRKKGLAGLIVFICKYIVFLLLHIFYLFPIKKNRIFFRANSGNRYACNPKYLSLYLQNKYPGEFDIIWKLNNDELKIDGVRVVTKLRKGFGIIILMRSKYIVTNTAFEWWIPVRKKQIVLETWHGGGAYKRVGIYEKVDNIFQLEQKLNAKQTTHYISSSKKFSEVQGPSKHIEPGKFINTGMPRNSIFFNNEMISELSAKIKKIFAIEEKTKVLLYAPTYRGETGYKSDGKENLLTKNLETIIKLQKYLKEKNNEKWIIIFRGHYFDMNLINSLETNIIDGTKYDDMQELLCVADILITDYSSSMWDFGLTNKPCFLLTPDIDEYIKERGFYTDPESWPFPICRTDSELINTVSHFNTEKYKKELAEYYDTMGSYECFDSCQKVFEAIGIN